MEDDIHNMKIQQTEFKMKKASISEKYYPGFACFFDSYLKSASITFKQCYEKLLSSQYQIQILSNPIKQILKSDSISQQDIAQKHQKLASRTTLGQHYLHFANNNEDDKKMHRTVIQYANRQEEETYRLECKLQEIQKSNNELRKSKFQEFQNKRKEQMKRLQMEAKLAKQQKKQSTKIV